VTLSVTAILQLRRPRVLRGMSPYGVRTFLQQASRLTSDHLPSGLIYHNQESMKGRNNLEAMKPGRNEEGRKRGIELFPGFLVS